MKKVMLGLVLVAMAGFAQDRVRFVNNTSLPVRIVAGSGRVPVCTLEPHSEQPVPGGFGQTENFYPVFDVPVTARFFLRAVRPRDPNFYYQIDDSRISGTHGMTITIDAVPPLRDEYESAYIVLSNISRTGGVSVSQTASSRLSRIDAGNAGSSDNVNAGESGVFRVNPQADNVMRVSSPVNVAFPPVVYRPGHRYVFLFDGAQVSLVDVRPLHTIGLPLSAAVVFSDTIPADKHSALAEALNGALAAHNAPLRVSEGAADGDDDAEVRYVFSLELADIKSEKQPMGGVVMDSGTVTLKLSRNGTVLDEVKDVVKTFNEAGLIEAMRLQLYAGERMKQWFQAIAEKTGLAMING
jgi:hypothetical protein